MTPVRLEFGLTGSAVCKKAAIIGNAFRTKIRIERNAQVCNEAGMYLVASKSVHDALPMTVSVTK